MGGSGPGPGWLCKEQPDRPSRCRSIGLLGPHPHPVQSLSSAPHRDQQNVPTGPQMPRKDRLPQLPMALLVPGPRPPAHPSCRADGETESQGSLVPPPSLCSAAAKDKASDYKAPPFSPPLALVTRTENHQQSPWDTHRSIFSTHTHQPHAHTPRFPDFLGGSGMEGSPLCPGSPRPETSVFVEDS